MIENNPADTTLFVTTAEQQRVLGLPPVPASYHPSEFVKLAGRAELAHYLYSDGAATMRRSEKLTARMHAGMAESVVVGLLNKVVELGDTYDAAALVPPAPAEAVEDTVHPMPEVFSPVLLQHFTMAAERRIAQVRALQQAEASYADFPAAAQF